MDGTTHATQVIILLFASLDHFIDCRHLFKSVSPAYGYHILAADRLELEKSATYARVDLVVTLLVGILSALYAVLYI